jgi:hypothetical protein
VKLPGRRVDVPEVGTVTVPVFAPDARGGALFHAVTNQNAGNLNSAVRIDARGDGIWSGWTKAPQVVQGAGLGAGRPVVDPHGATIDDQRGAGGQGGTPVQRIFEQRMAARRFG